MPKQTDNSYYHLYLDGARGLLCMATHSKLGLTKLVDDLIARQPYHLAPNQPAFAIIDGGVLGFPLADHLPLLAGHSAQPDRIIIMVHPQDPPRLRHRFSEALQGRFPHAICYFHEAGWALDSQIGAVSDKNN